MTCFNGKNQVSFYMENTTEHHARDLAYCTLDYSPGRLKEPRQFDRRNYKYLFRRRKSKMSGIKCDLPLTMKPSRPSLRGIETPSDNLPQLEKHHDFCDNEKRKQRLPASSRTTGKSLTSDISHFRNTNGNAELLKCQRNLTITNEENDADVNSSGSCICTIERTCFHTTDTSYYEMTKLNSPQSVAPIDFLQAPTGNLSNLQRRTNLVSDHDVVDNGGEKSSRITIECNSAKDTLLHNLFLWAMIKIRYILSSCRFREYVSTKTRKQSSIYRKWTFCLFFTLFLMRADSKRVFGNSLLISPGQLCGRTRYLTGKQHEICRNNSDILKYIKEAVILGSFQCQKVFQLHRWNCSSSPKNYYSKLLQQDIRETAFITALTSAALTYRMTIACTKGDVSNCGCLDSHDYIGTYELLKAEAKKRGLKVNETQIQHAAAKFDWGGCHDQLEYGEYISTLFTENFGRKYDSFDLKGKIEKHNMESGRKAVSSQMRESCRCHGITGTCVLKTCWKKLPPWTDVRNHLRNKFDAAIKVQLENDGRSLRPARKRRLAIKEYLPASKFPSDRDAPSSRSPRSFQTVRHRRRRKSSKARRKNARRHRNVFDKPFSVTDEDLVYSQESPNFCKKVRKHGTLGTTGRRCIPDITGAGSCSYLCCGRGFSQHTINVTSRCHCRFRQKQPGSLICDNCTKEETQYHCN